MSRPNFREQKILQSMLEETYGQILDVQQVLENDDEVCETIYELQNRFNAFSDKLFDGDRGIRQDPLNAFPPEVWQEIILETVHYDDYLLELRLDFLLTLTLVSVSWFQKITGNPLFWNKIALSRFTPDSAARVATCLELSRECPIYLIMNYSYDDWVKISPLVLAHVDRVVGLTLDKADVLNSMPVLPILRIFGLRAFTDALYNGEDHKILESVNLSRMPQLQRVPTKMSYPPITSPWVSFVEVVYLRCKALSDEQISSLRQAPHLRCVLLNDDRVDIAGSDAPSILLPNIESLTYVGPNARQMLALIGRSLTRLQIGCNYLDFLWDIIRIAQQTSLSDLTLEYEAFDGPRSLQSDESPHTMPKAGLFASSIKYLCVKFPYATSLDYYSWVESMRNGAIDALIGVENLSLCRVLLTPQVQRYIETLPSLRVLTLHRCVAESTESLSLRAPRTLRQLDCNFTALSLSVNPNESSSFEHLKVTLSFYRRDEPEDSDNNILPLICRESLGHDGSNIGISLAKSVPSISLYNVRYIEFFDDEEKLSIYAGDLLEIVALRPGDLPGLEEISFSKGPLEWDLLILMLERRNLRPHSGTSRISTIHLGIDPPMHLRRVLVALLAGYYPARKSLASYSLDAVGQRMFDPDLPGCYDCCLLLRDCDLALQPPDNQNGDFPSFRWHMERLNLDYALPHELMVAEPPLTKRDATCMAGLKGRRNGFKERFQKSIFVLSRAKSCPKGEIWTSFTLDASEYASYTA